MVSWATTGNASRPFSTFSRISKIMIFIFILKRIINDHYNVTKDRAPLWYEIGSWQQKWQRLRSESQFSRSLVFSYDSLKKIVDERNLLCIKWGSIRAEKSNHWGSRHGEKDDEEVEIQLLGHPPASLPLYQFICLTPLYAQIT